MLHSVHKNKINVDIYHILGIFVDISTELLHMLCFLIGDKKFIILHVHAQICTHINPPFSLLYIRVEGSNNDNATFLLTKICLNHPPSFLTKYRDWYTKIWFRVVK